MEHTGEGLVERRIAEAIERGEFDDLPGRGSPIPGLTGYDPPDWWIRNWLERERGAERTTDISEEIEQATLSTLLLPDEATVRQRIGEINAAIDEFNRVYTSGSIAQVAEEQMVAAWRAAARRRNRPE